MTTALDRIDDDAAELALTIPNHAALLQHPLRALPLAVRPDAWRVWICHRHLSGLDSPMAIAGAVKVWMANDGLIEEDAAAALKSLLSPMRMGSFKFASDLMTALAKEVDEAIRRRRIDRETEERRKQDDEAGKGAAGPDEVRRLLRERAIAGIGVPAEA